MLKKYSLYVQDYGAPIGYRLATKTPDKVQALLIQNGNAYEEGLRGFWNPLKNYWEKPNINTNRIRLMFIVMTIKLAARENSNDEYAELAISICRPLPSKIF